MSARRVYAATIVDGYEGWGDGLTALFFAEAMKVSEKCRVAVWDPPCLGTGHQDYSFRHRDHINAWFVDEWLDVPPKASEFDMVLATHFAHPVHDHILKRDRLEKLGFKGNWIEDPLYKGFLPPMDYDTGINIRRIHSDRCAYTLQQSMRPTLDIKNPPAGLPEKYVAFQIRKVDTTAGRKEPRLALQGEECEKWAREFIKKCSLPVVLLSDQVEGGIDASNLTLWQKLYVASKAEKAYVSHSGFGMAVAMYAGREKTKVVNFNPKTAFRNPCLGVFGNVETKLYSQEVSPYVTASYTYNHLDSFLP